MDDKVIFFSFSVLNTSVSDYFLALAELFIKNNYRVVVFSDTKKPEKLILPKDIILKYWPSKRPTTFRDAKFLYIEMKFYKPVLTISVFNSVNLFLIVGFLCGVKLRVAWIRTLTTQFPQKNILVKRKSMIYKLATKIIVNSNATKQDAVLNYQVSEKKIYVIPNSVKDVYETIPASSGICKKTITYVGRLHYSKGVETLIQAFDIVVRKHPYIELIIIGNGPEEAHLKQLTTSLNLQERVFFKGTMSKLSVLEAFKKTYIAVVPSVTEAFGFTLIEGMSMKTLVIGANNTGIKEIIIHNKTGLLFETHNYKDLANKLNCAIENNKLRDQLTTAGYERFLECFETEMAIKRDYLYFKNMIHDER
ncbi:glycosyltransferase family 4 protein [Gelidibacter japonicus]|uniref:glycosyltransferase family 4 protein n=1 Tax=Gelidibacter japonicus TaxID=1962232 RepID=UPI0013CFD259|nr:glycosyltransferase family 4 protein [Gelidibacter japonicus]